MKKLKIIFIVDVLFVMKKMVMGNKYGMIHPNMKESGKITNLMDMENIIFLMEKNILKKGKKVVKMDLENFI